MAKFNDYLDSEAWKDYYTIEAYQYIPDVQERDLVVAEIEKTKTASEAKAIIAKYKGDKE